MCVIDSARAPSLKPSMSKLWFALVFGAFATLARAEEEDAGKADLSPDRRWEYRVVDNEPRLVDAKTGELAVDFETGTALAAETGQVLWAPDSRRFAFNFRAGGRYYTCAVYELVAGKWKALPPLEENAEEVSKMIERAEQRDRKRLGVARDAHRRRIMDEWKVRRWINPDTFEAMALSTGTVVVDKESEEIEGIGGAVLFRVRCDNKGSWDLIRKRELSDAELEKMAKENEAKD